MPPASTSMPISPAELSYLYTSLCHTPPIRPDSRSAIDFRPFRAETDLLPVCNGSSHLSLADGSEALVGVRADVQRTPRSKHNQEELEEMTTNLKLGNVAVEESNSERRPLRPSGDPKWICLTVDISTLRDDNPILVFLSEMLREPLVAPTAGSGSGRGSSLADALVINENWHWELYIDVLLLSPFTASSSGTATGYPLPLLSLAIHLALRSTRLPRLKSQGEEDPLADDDWEQSEYLFPRADDLKVKKNEGQESKQQLDKTPLTPPMHIPAITLLVMTAGSNIIFDPSSSELAVADAVFAVSVIVTTQNANHLSTPRRTTETTVLAFRTIETPARQTMKGRPLATSAPVSSGQSDTSTSAAAAAAATRSEGEDNPGIWKPKVGGVKREMVRRIVRAVVGHDQGQDEEEDATDSSRGVAKDVFDGLEAFLRG